MSDKERLVDIATELVAVVLPELLMDRATRRNIIWATDTYAELGEGFGDRESLSATLLLQHADAIRPRIAKPEELQQQRTRSKAEVFTPAWLCNDMLNAMDEAWFGRPDVFTRSESGQAGTGWTVSAEPIQEFPRRRTWRHYVDARRLEITCGEAPYLVSRYDAATGERIPTGERIGILDRKLRLVNENTTSQEEWERWALRAVEASYGYEYQGDSLLIARVNVLLTFAEYYEARWGELPRPRLLRTVAHRISWNLWQMDGLKDTVPLGKPYEPYEQLALFELPTTETRMAVPCKVHNWRSQRTYTFRQTKEMQAMGKKKLFDFVIGNPPYNEDFENSGENGNFAKPVYNLFMDASYEIAESVELIHPARFLFNAGSTPKSWNKKMLNNVHFKVLSYEANSSAVFPNTDIKGGVAISYYNEKEAFEPIEIFTAFDELNSILKKVKPKAHKFLNTIISGRGVYKLSNKALKEHPEIENIQSKGHKKDVGAGAFNKLVNIVFFKDKPTDGHEYVKFLGLLSGKRCYYWGRKEYQDVPDSFFAYKVFIPKANGSGALGEVLSTPLIGAPLIGATETFLSIGSFQTELEAENCLKYVKSKFARVMLGTLKITQDNTKEKWKYVPLQDFTSNSDIDWSQSIADIDKQLYRKYGLSQAEIDFIETHVKEMA